MLALTIFDLDHTLLDGDSDVLWCDFLIDQGLLDRVEFSARNADMERAYRVGGVSAQAFCDFYVATLAGRSAAAWEPLRRAFLETVIAPRIPPSAHALVQRHRAAGDRMVLSTATNRFLSELTAVHLGLADLIATECESDEHGFTGRTAGVLNMREGKVHRLQAWLAQQGLAWDECNMSFYSDSINDLPLLEAVCSPVAVNPDAGLAALAAERGWAVIRLQGSAK